jgi:hypothetical protein
VKMDTPLDKTTQPEAWQNIKATLRVSVYANDTLVAESNNPILWAQILRAMGDHKP